MSAAEYFARALQALVLTLVHAVMLDVFTDAPQWAVGAFGLIVFNVIFTAKGGYR